MAGGMPKMVPKNMRKNVPSGVIWPTIAPFCVSVPFADGPAITAIILIAAREPIPPAMNPAISPASVVIAAERNRLFSLSEKSGLRWLDECPEPAEPTLPGAAILVFPHVPF